MSSSDTRAPSDHAGAAEAVAPRILILDDDAETQRLLGALLSQRGYRVCAARRIADARALLQTEVFDLLVVDGLLPDGNGAQFIAELRGEQGRQGDGAGAVQGRQGDGAGAVQGQQDGAKTVQGRHRGAKIVFVSSFFRGLDNYRHLTRDLGVSQVITKPFSPQEFLFQVQSLLPWPASSAAVAALAAVAAAAQESAPRVLAQTQVETRTRVEALFGRPTRAAILAPAAASDRARATGPEGEHARAAREVQATLRSQLVALHAAYASSLPDKVDALRQALTRARAGSSEALKEARLLAHRMHGTAGSYGFAGISQLAGAIEREVLGLGEPGAAALASPARWAGIDDLLAAIGRQIEAVVRHGKAPSELTAAGPATDHHGVVSGARAGGPVATAPVVPVAPTTPVVPVAPTAPAALTSPAVPAAAAGTGAALAATAAPATVLVVDDDDDFLAHVASLGQQTVIRVLTAHTADEAVDRARRHPVDAALIDVLLARGEDPQQVAERLRMLPGMAGLPLAFISADGRLSNRIAAVHAGVSLFLNKPLAREDFDDAVHQLMAGNDEQERPRILIVDDEEHCAAELADLLADHRYEPHVLRDPTLIVETIEQLRPDLLLLDLLMPEVSGFDICKIVRANPSWHIPLVVTAVHASPEVRVAAFAAGADDYLVRPIIEEELLVRIRQRLAQARQARDRSDRDPLTGLLSRRAFIRAFPTRLGEVERRQQPLSLCMIDLDHFKRINDTYGHLAGDRVLAHFGRMLAIRFRGSDLRCRWGGEEFLVAFVGEDQAAAREILDRVRHEFRAVVFTGDAGHPFGATFSAGISGYPLDGRSLEELLRVADERMYHAKREGRSRTRTGKFPRVGPV